MCGLTLTACSPVGPDFVAPEPEAPAEWAQAVDQGLEVERDEVVEWWRVFNDAVLDKLVGGAPGSLNRRSKKAPLRPSRKPTTTITGA